MLLQDPKLPFLGIAWSSHKMADVFNTQVLPAVPDGGRVESVHIDDMTYTPGRECVVLYRLEPGPRGRVLSERATVTFAKDDRLVDLFNRRHRERPEGRSAVCLPDYRCLVELFPADWRLPFLAKATRPEEVDALLQRAGIRQPRAPPSGAVAVRVLRYRPHRRCVLRYTASVGGESGSGLIGKVYPEGAAAIRAWRALETIGAMATTGGVVIPHPLKLLGGSLLVMEQVSGTSLKGMLERTTEEGEAEDLVMRAARTLAVLHGLHVPASDVRTTQTEEDLLRKRVARLPRVAPQLAQEVTRVLDEAAARIPQAPLDTHCFIHGDYKPSQLLVDGDCAAVLDFDRSCVGDPAIDVGNFMAELRKESILTGGGHLRPLAGRFLAVYEGERGVPGFADRARLFQVVALARMAVRRFARSPHVYAREGLRSLPHRLLREAAECLGEQSPAR